jgi:putative transposase
LDYPLVRRNNAFRTQLPKEESQMKYDPDKHNRHSVRLRGYDYSRSGAYFITVCTHDRECLFGEIVNGTMCLSEFGNVVAEEWTRSREIRREIELDEWALMPNHVHGIVVITADLVGPRSEQTEVGTHGRASLRTAAHNLGRAFLRNAVGDGGRASLGNGLEDAGLVPLRRKPRSLSSFVAGFKSATTRRINNLRDSPGARVWQGRFYEHIIRNDPDLERIRAYVCENPTRWESDEDNPVNFRRMQRERQ